MKYIALVSLALLGPATILAIANPCSAQMSAGRRKVEAAYKFQEKLIDSTATIEEVIGKWSRIARDTDVRKDADALAISYGCEGLLELQQGKKFRADSLLIRAMPLFRLTRSKAYFLVAYAELERQIKHYDRAMRSYEEIVTTMDSMPELWDIQYYRASGYAPYAYAIDASLGIEQIGSMDAEYHKKAVELLSATMDRHPVDALGLMALVALHHLGAIQDVPYKFKLDLLCSRKPELRAVSETFDRKF